MSILYRGPLVRVSDQAFEVLGPPLRAYPIGDLRGVHVVEEPLTKLMTSVPIRTCSVALTAPAALLAAVGWPLFDQPAITALGIALLAGLVTVAAACWLVRPWPYELRAYYRGQLVTLLQTRDRLAFGQVTRALTRAFEHLDDSVTAHSGRHS
jgi:Family of unknown function (DUF6232)